METDKKFRSAIKALSWRIIATITTFIISYFITGNFTFATSISIVEVAIKFILYYAHERAWQFFDIWQHKPQNINRTQIEMQLND